MRIIAGNLGGRQFDSPAGHRTHPMSDKMRGALFNTLGDIKGLTVLDAFAGSGAISFEAVSRGASALAIEVDSSAQRTIADNIQRLNLAHTVKLVRASAEAWLRTKDQTFDIVICDPPYDKPQIHLLTKLAGRSKPGGVVVLSLSAETDLVLPNNFQLLSAKDYGDGRLSFYRALG